MDPNSPTRKIRTDGNASDAMKMLKYGAAGMFGFAVYRKVQNLREMTVEDVMATSLYQAYYSFCLSLVDRGWYPRYFPTDLNGRQMDTPSTSPKVYSIPPLRLEDSKVLKPITFRGLTLRNRVVRAAAFDGIHEEEIIQTHVEQSKGGVGMTVVAYCCVSANGLTFDGQLVMEEKRRGFLERLTSSVHEYGAAVCAQLTHAGSFADRSVIGEQQQAPSRMFNLAGFDWPREMTHKDLEIMSDNFARAALLAKETGFDAIELHCGHGYLLSQFLSPFHNFRTDEYGGSPENRARFPVECFKKCRRVVGEDFPIIVKLNMHDGMYKGLELCDSLVAANMLIDASADGIVLTCGNVLYNGLYMLRGHLPISKLAQALPSFTERIATATFGPLAIPKTEFDPCFLRESARQMRDALGGRVPLCLMGGLNSFGEMEGAIDEGFEFVQVARALIREPDWINKIQATLELNAESHVVEPVDVESKCIRCNMCVVATVDHTVEFGCPFQKMDAKIRASQGKDPVLSVQGMKEVLCSEAPAITPQMVSACGANADIEDLFKPKL